MNNKISAVLFDLDGTLLDTAPDLAGALNTLLHEQGQTPLPFEKIRPWCSEGSRGLLKLGLGIDEQHPNFTKLRHAFLQIYQRDIAAKTQIFPGIAELLNYLDKQKLTWGIVTNKPVALAKQLLAKFDFKNCACLIGGDSLAKCKPDPEPLLYACQQIGVTAEVCIYIGDAQRDIQAAKRANMLAVAALYGYRTPDERPEDWAADFYIDSPQAIISWLATRC